MKKQSACANRHLVQERYYSRHDTVLIRPFASGPDIGV